MSISTQNPVKTLETTGSVRRMEEVTRTHMFRIVGYSLDKHIGKGKFLESTNFDVGGHEWSIHYYPNGSNEAKKDDISLFLCLKSKSKFVRAQFCFAILDQSECVTLTMRKSVIRNFNSVQTSWGYLSFSERTELESYIKDDCFVIKSVISVFKDFPVEPNAHIAVPPGKIVQQLGHLLDNGYGADVTFEVDGQTLRAHKCILAVRSPVFLAQFYGPMKEKSDSIIKIEEMESVVFKGLLHFMYNDSFPGFEETNGSDEKQNHKLMAQHLLVAADRYGLERLKIICENMLCSSIDTSNVTTLLPFAERHGCNHLKETCLKFLAPPGTLQKLAGTEQFQYLLKNDPLILKELLEKQVKLN